MRWPLVVGAMLAVFSWRDIMLMNVIPASYVGPDPDHVVHTSREFPRTGRQKPTDDPRRAEVDCAL